MLSTGANALLDLLRAGRPSESAVALVEKLHGSPEKILSASLSVMIKKKMRISIPIFRVLPCVADRYVHEEFFLEQ